MILKQLEHILKAILKELDIFYHNFKEGWKDETYIKVKNTLKDYDK